MEFEFEKRDREALARLRTLGRRVGCAIIVVTVLWSIGWMYKILMLLINE